MTRTENYRETEPGGALDLNSFPPARRSKPVQAERVPPIRLSDFAPALSLVVLFLLAVRLPGFLPGQIYSCAFLLVMPGGMLLATSAELPSSGWLRLAASAGASLLLLMLAGLGLSLILPALGVGHPFTPGRIAVPAGAMAAAAALVASRRGDPVDRLLGYACPTPAKFALIAGFAILPLAALVGAEMLNRNLTNVVAVAATAASGLVLIAMAVISERLRLWVLGVGLFCVSLALLWSYSLRGSGVFGFDIQRELQASAVTYDAGAWRIPPDGDAYRSMLSITALPAMLSTVTGLTGEILLKVVYPMLFALVPVVLAVLSDRWLPRSAAFVAAAYFLMLPQFSSQMVALARQEIAMLFVVLLVALAFDKSISLRLRKAAVVLAGCGVAISHYTTAYLTSGLLAGTWGVYLLYRLIQNRRGQTVLPPVLAAWVVLAVVGATLVWTVAVTQSAPEPSMFTSRLSAEGLDLFPQKAGGPVVDRWLRGNAPETISASEFYRRSEIILRETSPWINHYPPEVAAAYPPKQGAYPEISGNRLIRSVAAALSTLAGQAFLAATIGGLGLLTLARRRYAQIELELAILGLGMLGFVALMRVSGAAALAFNPERAQLISLGVLVVPLAAAAAWFLQRWPGPAMAVLCLGLGAIFFQGSGLAVQAGGGNPTANLNNAGTGYERFTVSEEEYAAARWLAASAKTNPLVYADRFGRIRLLGTDPAFERAVVESVTPLTLDQGAWVYARAVNIEQGRAEGSLGQDFAVYVFPRNFLDENKNLVYSTESTRIWK